MATTKHPSHIQVPRGLGSTSAVVCGSPERAEWIAGLLDKPKEIAKNREYHSYLGSRKGKKIIVTSHGIGSAGAAICFQDLCDVGVTQIIRVGTAGALQGKMAIGDIVIPYAAIRQDGVSVQMIPPEYPAVADPERYIALTTLAHERKIKFHAGINLTSDLFYPGPLPSSLEFYSKAGVVSVEMECSTLFVIASLRKIAAAALVVLDGNPLKWKDGEYDPSPARLKASLETSSQLAIDVLVAHS